MLKQTTNTKLKFFYKKSGGNLRNDFFKMLRLAKRCDDGPIKDCTAQTARSMYIKLFAETARIAHVEHELLANSMTRRARRRGQKTRR